MKPKFKRQLALEKIKGKSSYRKVHGLVNLIGLKRAYRLASSASLKNFRVPVTKDEEEKEDGPLNTDAVTEELLTRVGPMLQDLSVDRHTVLARVGQMVSTDEFSGSSYAERKIIRDKLRNAIILES